MDDDKTVLDYLAEWLKRDGYDGLYNTETEDTCACFLDDLAPCGGESLAVCHPGYKRTYAYCEEHMRHGCDHVEATKQPDTTNWHECTACGKAVDPNYNLLGVKYHSGKLGMLCGPVVVKSSIGTVYEEKETVGTQYVCAGCWTSISMRETFSTAAGRYHQTPYGLCGPLMVTPAGTSPDVSESLRLRKQVLELQRALYNALKLAQEGWASMSTAFRKQHRYTERFNELAELIGFDEYDTNGA